MLAGMFSRAIKAAMRETIEELVSPQFQRIDARMDRFESELRETGARITETAAHLGARIDETADRLESRIAETAARLDARMDEMNGRLSARIDEMGVGLSSRVDDVTAQLGVRIDSLTAQQMQLVKEMGSMRVDLGALKSGFDLAGTLIHRIDRLEDRVFAKIG